MSYFAKKLCSSNFQPYCTAVERKIFRCVPSILEEGYVLIRSKRMYSSVIQSRLIVCGDTSSQEGAVPQKVQILYTHDILPWEWGAWYRNVANLSIMTGLRYDISKSIKIWIFRLTLLWWMFLSYRNRSIALQSMVWFLYDSTLRHKRVNLSYKLSTTCCGSQDTRLWLIQPYRAFLTS